MRGPLTILITAVLAGAVAACSSSGSGGASVAATSGAQVAPATSASAASTGAAGSSGKAADAATKAAVAKAYATFFDPATSLATAVANLQNGAKLKSALIAQAKAGAQQHLGARVTKVSLLSPDSASVVFDLLSSGKVLLPNTPGNAVRVAGHWTVAARTFCGLVQLTGKAPAACSDPSIVDLPH